MSNNNKLNELRDKLAEKRALELTPIKDDYSESIFIFQEDYPKDVRENNHYRFCEGWDAAMDRTSELVHRYKMLLDVVNYGLIDFKKYGLKCDDDIVTTAKSALDEFLGEENEESTKP